MNLLLLPGNSPDHKEWIASIENLLKPIFKKTLSIKYDHWLPGSATSIADLDVETAKIQEATNDWGDYCIFAKSIGVALALKCIRAGVISPQKCVFVGTPVLWTRQNSIDLDSWIEDFKIPSLFIQQVQDPCMPSSELKSYLIEKRVVGYSYVEIEGDDHNYEASSTVSIATKFYL